MWTLALLAYFRPGPRAGLKHRRSRGPSRTTPDHSPAPTVVVYNRSVDNDVHRVDRGGAPARLSHRAGGRFAASGSRRSGGWSRRARSRATRSAGGC